MATKCTWLFNGSASGLNWGFSESWYTGLTGAAAEAAMDTVSNLRRVLLSFNSEIVGYRISTVNGLSYVIRRSYAPPRANDFSNMPVDSALCQVGIQGLGKVKKFWIHDLPDDWVTRTQIVEARQAQIRVVINAYPANGFQVRVQDVAAPSAKILSVTQAGLVTTIAPHGMVAGTEVLVLRCRDISGRSVKGTYIVTSVPTPATLTLAHWPTRDVARSGSIRVVVYQYLGASSLGDRGVIKGGARKVGRPFFQLRGRAANRT